MIDSMFELTGCVALVSGAASGMGRAMALAFAKAGADLMLVDLNADGVSRTAAEIEALGQRATPARCDVSEPDQIRELFKRLDVKFGRIDVLANVAGEGLMAKPEEITLDQLKQVLQNLVVGRFCCCQEGGRR